MVAIIFCGIQGSGKTTFYLERFFGTHIRISLDVLKTRHREEAFLRTCLETGQRFVVDNTNPTVAARRRYIEPALAAGYRVVGFFFKTPPQAALARNERRLGKERIPVSGVLGTYKRLELPTFVEGFSELYRVRSQAGRFSVEALDERAQ
jgi:predicted kinase